MSKYSNLTRLAFSKVRLANGLEIQLGSNIRQLLVGLRGRGLGHYMDDTQSKYYRVKIIAAYNNEIVTLAVLKVINDGDEIIEVKSDYFLVPETPTTKGQETSDALVMCLKQFDCDSMDVENIYHPTKYNVYIFDCEPRLLTKTQEATIEAHVKLTERNTIKIVKVCSRLVRR